VADASGMEASDDLRLDLPTGPLPALGRVLAEVVATFEAKPLLGAVLVDGSPISRIEDSHGHGARSSVMQQLGALVSAVAKQVLGEGAIVVAGETGRLEVIVLTFREGRDGRFYRDDLPNLVRAIDHALEKRGHRTVYPYAKKAPEFGVGFAALVRNPFLGADTQIRAAIEDAREDAQLKRKTVLRAQRHAFLSVLLAGRVSSVYEPIVDVATKTVYGYEALARGPAGTELHSPAVLFEAAEEHRLVFELDCLCRQSGLDGAIGLPEGTHLFLNVRPTAIHDPYFRPDTVMRTLERSGLSPSSLVFEISEKESIANFAAFREIRDEYKSLGFRFALDDTGAGYASLQAVIELAPDFVKVDRSFVAGVDTDRAKQTLVRALQSVADSIGAQIVGEGLDTLEELEMLGKLNIPFGQGWLFGKPTPLR
jgi:EAL domain-containing protein (putative c-di-GMP-specific phosphodiesterase class I)